MFEDLRHRIESSFEKQSLMRSFDAKISAFEPGFVTISAPISDGALQQQGYAHAVQICALAASCAQSARQSWQRREMCAS